MRVTEDQKDKILKWFLSGDTGLSSKALASCFLGHDYEDQYFAPRDPSDVGRCLRLIRIVPEIRRCVDILAKKHKIWALVAPHWDAIEKSMIDEVGIDWEKGRSAPITFNLMSKVFRG